MAQNLSAILESKWIVEWNADASAIDFVIDGESLKLTLLREAESRGEIKRNSSLPSFIGIPQEAIGSYRDAFLPRRTVAESLVPKDLAPVLVCGGCGDPHCGGVWTRVVVGPEEVRWEGFGFWSAAQETFAPNYDATVRIFDRNAYEALLKSLIPLPEDEEPKPLEVDD